jgi:TMEM175 potassium channel family protein
MEKGRLEAFSDGVVAVIITIMVLEMKVPHEVDVTGWMGENKFAPTPTALYGVVLLMAAIAYWILQRTIIADQGDTSVLAAAVGNDFKGKLSLVCYAVAIPIAFIHEWISGGLYVLMALIWLVPDRRIERALTVSRRRQDE